MGTDQTSKFCPTCQKQSLWARPSTNHLLHLLVTLFLCGFWLPVWILASIKIGGWRCQTCGYRGSAVSRLVALVVVPVVCIGLFLVVLGAFAANIGSNDSATAPTNRIQPAEATIEAEPEPAMVADDGPAADSPNTDAASESGIETDYRTWVDATGKHRTEGKFVGLASGQVTLEKRGGSRVTLPLEKLSADDQAWIETSRSLSLPVLAGKHDIVRSCELRSGPGEEFDRKINHKATDMIGELHYLSVDSSVTVTVVQTKGDWAEIQFESVRGWVPREVVKDGAATKKREGWIRHTCRVYPSPDNSANPIGYLSEGSSIGVADDGSAWLRLTHGPVKSEATNKFLDVSFDDGFYVEAANFTTELPAHWDR